MTKQWSPALGGANTAETLLLGKSRQMEQVRNLIRKVANYSTSVLISGPSGSGKERVARAIHAESDRAAGPFVAINCGAIPRELLESDLFGHEKGSFTGAHAMRQGRFEEAHKGTLFLDEIGDMPHDMQVKLLRVLEERTVERVGGRGSIPIDVRVLSATHRDLAVAIDEQRFREDLFYRLAVFPIHLPGLGERTEDIAQLARHFLRNCGAGTTGLDFTPDALTALARHPWPGNVRELRNFVERAAILHAGETINGAQVDALLLRAKPVPQRPTMSATILPDQREIDPAGIDLRTILADLEARYIKEALSRTNGVVADAARLLGLQRTTLVEKMRRYAV
jgi:sigma-54 dependent transcriptional regulator, flagellar regulatory protein